MCCCGGEREGGKERADAYESHVDVYASVSDDTSFPCVALMADGELGRSALDRDNPPSPSGPTHSQLRRALHLFLSEYRQGLQVRAVRMYAI